MKLKKGSDLMKKVILICGKICSGKSYYIKKLKENINAVILSPDEATYELINNEQGEFYDIFSKRLINYLNKKAVEIVQAGANVIYERGLWTKKERQETKEYFKQNNIECEIHYICVDNETWSKNILERNKSIKEGINKKNFYLDEGLMKKLQSGWEEPTEDEIDVIYRVNR